MNKLALSLVALVSVLAVACGGSQPPAETAPEGAAPAAPTDAPAAPADAPAAPTDAPAAPADAPAAPEAPKN